MRNEIAVVDQLDHQQITTAEQGVDHVKLLQKAVAACLAVGADREKTNKYAEQLVRSIRTTGQLSAKLKREPGKRQPGKTDFTRFVESSGRTRQTISNWESVGEIPEFDFDALIEEIKAKDDPKAIITATPFYRLARPEPPRPRPYVNPEFPAGPWQTLVIDPPWPIKKAVLDRRPVERTAMDYVTWTDEQLKHAIEDPDELPIGKLADSRGAHVYLWVTHKYLPTGLKMFETWGVRYECMLTWYKPTAQPLWWMYNTEHCLFGKVGSSPLLKKGRPTGFQAPQQRHSHKPDEFYELVRTVSPDRRLTMFDEPREGFTHWGIQHVDAG